MKKMLFLLLAATLGLAVNAQLLTWTPPFPKEADPSQTLVITMDATKGNQGLLNYSATSDVYVHIGIITNRSTGTGWSNVPFQWATTNPAARATYIGNNKWTFTITGSLRNFFFMTGSDTTIRKIGILFRSGDGTRAQRNADGSDMFVPIYPDGLAVRIDNPARQPLFNPVAEPQNLTIGSSISMTANANAAANLKLYHNGNLVASANGVQTLSGNSTITTPGNQQLIAEAVQGATTRYDTLNIFVTGSTPVVALPAGVRDGINYEPGDTSVTLVLRAPGKNNVVVTGEFNNWTPTAAHIMNKTPDGRFFWVRVRGLNPGTQYAYQYLIDGNLKIADPYAELVLDPFNDQFIPASTYPNLKPYPAGQSGIVAVLQTARPAYNWSVPNFTRPDKRGLVVYELLVRDFVADRNWKAVQDTLNYLRRMGVNAIEIMPFNEFEGNISWGYNPSYFFAPDKYYGTPNALKQFVDSCHAKGIAVIMDIALNHAFGQSPMVQMYWDAANNRPAADNPWFNPAARHAFNVGYDFNHESLDTRYFTSRVIEYWLQEYKIDGYRFDLSKGFTQVQTCDVNGNNCNVGQWNAYDASRVAIWKRYYDTLQLKSANSYAILEHLSENQEEKELADYGMLFWGNLNHNYSQAAKGNSNGWDLSWAVHTQRTWTKPHLMSYMESHDEERLMYRMINEGSFTGSYSTRDTTTALKRMELTAALFFTIPGPKMIWQFGELGYPYSINYCVNGTVNNNCRLDPKPIRWDYLTDPRRKRVYDVYSTLINLRFHPAYREAFLSGIPDYSLGGAVKWIRLSSGDSSRLLVVGNFDVSPQTAMVAFQTPGTWYDLFNNQTFTATGAVQSIALQPGEYRLFLNRNLTNIPTTSLPGTPVNAAALEARIYPNPAGSRFTLQLELPESGPVTVELYSALGQFAGTLRTGFLPRGNHRLALSSPGAAKGSYYLQIKTKSITKSIPVNIQ
jgi:glycosidase